jgi:hypothetical protein
MLSNMPPPSQMPPRFFVPEPAPNPMAGLDSPHQPEQAQSQSQQSQQPQQQQIQQQQTNTQMFNPGITFNFAIILKPCPTKIGPKMTLFT